MEIIQYRAHGAHLINTSHSIADCDGDPFLVFLLLELGLQLVPVQPVAVQHVAGVGPHQQVKHPHHRAERHRIALPHRYFFGALYERPSHSAWKFPQ